ncbi:hypothetical protein TRIP_B350210 [uncultured Desulfatiglans sp.]|uniref:Uncharacterized protein n=1 Tax=Uncultured Desulfatiglans sp. TaxID=1748965 RepID=A0A653AAM1_UNCDX|nr:hypothetical protein TRIP_B350210 [uncultured Desulfatiglans sp.]
MTFGLCGYLSISLAKNKHKIGNSSVPNHNLVAVDDPLVIHQNGARGPRASIAASIWLGYSETHNGIPGYQPGQVSALLLFCSIKDELLSPKGNRTELLSNARINAPKLFSNQRLLQKTKTCPAISFRDKYTHKTQFCTFFYKCTGNLFFLLTLPSYISKLPFCKFTCGFLNILLLHSQLKLHYDILSLTNF